MMRSFRQKPVGWRNESLRHSLAARGIRTYSRKSVSSIYEAKTLPARILQRTLERRSDIKSRVGERVGESVAAQEALLKQQLESDVSLEGLSKEEKRRALFTGLRPEEEAKKEEILKQLGIGLAKRPSLLELAKQWIPDVHGQMAIDELGRRRDRQLQIAAEAEKAMANAKTVQERDVARKVLNEARENERRIRAEAERIKRLQDRFKSGEKLSLSERQLMGKQVRDFNRRELARVL